MLFRFTDCVIDFVKCSDVVSKCTVAENRFCEWAVDICTIGDSQFFLVSNVYSLYSFIFETAGIASTKTFVKVAINKLREHLYKNNLFYVWYEFIRDNADNIVIEHTYEGKLSVAMRVLENTLFYSAKWSIDTINRYFTEYISTVYENVSKGIFTSSDVFRSEIMKWPPIAVSERCVKAPVIGSHFRCADDENNFFLYNPPDEKQLEQYTFYDRPGEKSFWSKKK